MDHHEFGFVTVAMGSERYLEMAVDMVLSLRRFHADPVCLMCDEPLQTVALSRYDHVFDIVVCMPGGLVTPMESNFLLSECAPFERGFYIDADVLVLGSLEAYIEDTRSKPITMMGEFVGPGSGQRHHGIPIDRLLRHFNAPSFFKNHSGALGYQREPARAFFARSRAIYRELYSPRWRFRVLLATNLAFGLAAAGTEMARMQEPFPVIWPKEMPALTPTAPAPKPLLHFIGCPPAAMMHKLMQEVDETEAPMGPPDRID